MAVSGTCTQSSSDVYGSFSLTHAPESGSAPRVSILMAVFNGEHAVDEAVCSVLGQTFSDFEFLIADDGSTDGSLPRLRHYQEQDPRVRIVSQANMGLTKTLNRLLRLARGAYIARQDHDDVWLPEKLARQAAYMDAHPEAGIVGTRYRVLLPGGEMRDAPEKMRISGDAAIRRALDRYNPFMHASVMLRREQVLACGGYDDAYDVAQDYELWLRLRSVGTLEILPDICCVRREPGATRLSGKRKRQRLNVFRAKRRHGLAADLPGLAAAVKDLGAALLPDGAQRALLFLRERR